MRVQMEGQTLRLRVDEAELARLLSGGSAENCTLLPDGRTEIQRIRLADALAWRREDAIWNIDIPEADVRALSDRLPSRDGLHFSFSGSAAHPLEVLFDVDVRDSARRRFHKSSEGDAS
ncbi:hypothetical protein EKH79_01365 [Dyella dinghuensis]|uniref:Uncharacterized protein n=1 Tax=Dyella dinghuensis TaxID=1920169 RepID=A0A432LX42_9GAMM|nr:hypothetical protein [Dyella dinghuensis]RUL66507.1 hypothetical protein EKH79_01365 [Dyella dinghuensis]